MSGPKDKVSATDYVEAGIHTVATDPTHACPVCQKAMKDHNTDETKEQGKDIRICSNRQCRAQADWASGSAVLLNN